MAAVAVAKSGFAVVADAVLGENWDHENDGDPLFTSIFMCDSYGNNALHLAVLHDLPQVFDFAIQRAMQSLAPSDKAVNETPEHLVAFLKRVDDMTRERILSFVRQRNCDELTPLSLAAAVGITRMFQHILQSLTSVAWTYSPITAINIPLRDLEEPEPRPPFKYKGLVGLFHTLMITLPYPLVPKGTSGYKTAIQCLCSYERLSCAISKSQADRFQQILANRLEMLKLVQINQLFRKKWKFVGKRRFLVRLVLYLVFLFTFNTSTLFATNIYDDENVAEWKPIVMGLAEGISFTMATIKFCNELFQLLFTFKDYTSEVGAGRLDNVCTMVTCICLFISGIMRAL
ncbi:hypothetical protein Poli38472_012432 [Pythium oligandrum]|uniref:Uncharacterized protein n=1 Tax=Pythium oligandrum TaxID=41045 RepID=A0A8K1CRF8_PYTOL|nr:hypothetical protein Poli38472_012432 [Pythium oligandrum]|eukprot:TMW67316.1 hypothetical protein Poli38472_012432 [Pythium oligandrum]